MMFGILGPLEVGKPGERIVIGAAKQRQLLAVLLLAHHRVVATERLVDELWQDDPPLTARGTLQSLVLRLRRLLSGLTPQSMLVRHPPGYVLRIADEQLDTHRFEALATRGRQAAMRGDWQQASIHLRDALDIWRGPALADVPASPGISAAAVHLEEMRMAVLAQRIEADMRLDLHDRLVGELRALVATHPLQEKLWELLITALYRSERRADALAAYHEVRRTLTAQLGLDPGHRLQRLQHEILTGAAAVQPTR
jgi:DNA-binding SARP family transcriptional activator